MSVAMKSKIFVYTVCFQEEDHRYRWIVKLMIGKHSKVIYGNYTPSDLLSLSEHIVKKVFLEIKKPCSIDWFVFSPGFKESIDKNEMLQDNITHDIQWFFLNSDSMPVKELKAINPVNQDVA